MWVTVAVRVTGMSQDLHGGHETRLRATAFRWDPGKLGRVSEKVDQEKKGNICCSPIAHQAGGLTRVLSPAVQGAGTIVPIKLIKILRL